MQVEWQSGIDSIAHKTTLEEKGKTIAVLGGGFKHIYPKENIGLYQQIIKNCGLVISEYAPNVKAESSNFLQRNRIVSGLSLAVLIIESAHRSGTSVTARLAKQQNRKVFAIPHEIYDIHGVGNNRLIRDNIATIACSTEEIMKAIPGLQYKKVVRKEKITSKREKIYIDKLNENSQMKEKVTTNKKICKNKEYNEIYKFISEIPCTLNELYQNTNNDIKEIMNILFLLELDGYIEKVAGGYKCITNN